MRVMKNLARYVSLTSSYVIIYFSLTYKYAAKLLRAIAR